MALVHGQEHYTESSPPSRETESHSRRRVVCDEGQVRLDAMSEDIPKDRQDDGTTGSGPLRIQTYSPTSTIRALATRPRGNGMRCIQPRLGKDEGICKPSVEPDRQSPSTGSITTDYLSDCHTTMETTTVVSNGTKQGNGDVTSSTKKDRPHTNDSQSQPTRHNTATSHVDYLKERYRSKCLSGEALQLLLASWRPKSSKTYYSLFTKWASWSNERGSDPVSGDIGEVVNFLAYLFNEGYQYRCLNSDRSAISSVHKKVDGNSVGEHPLVP